MPALLAENVLAFLIERALRRQVRWYRRKFSVLICVSCTYKDFFIFRSLILTAVLLAAGAVLKFFAGSVINIGGMKPNFIIAMYCLAILLIRPSLPRAAVIGELDPGASEQIFRLLRRMNEAHGMTVIVVEQKIMLLSAYAKKLAVLNDGQLELFGPVREVLRHSARLEAIGVHCPRVVTLSNRLADLTGGALAADLDEAETLVREVLA